MSLNKTPFFELRSGSVDALQFVVKTTDLDALRNELTRRFEQTPEFFSGEVVTIDVRRLGETERASIADIAHLLGSVRMRPIGVVAGEAQASRLTGGAQFHIRDGFEIEIVRQPQDAADDLGGCEADGIVE